MAWNIENGNLEEKLRKPESRGTFPEYACLITSMEPNFPAAVHYDKSGGEAHAADDGQIGGPFFVDIHPPQRQQPAFIGAVVNSADFFIPGLTPVAIGLLEHDEFAGPRGSAGQEPTQQNKYK